MLTHSPSVPARLADLPVPANLGAVALWYDESLPSHPWHLWIPPTSAEHYEGGDVANGDLLDSYGDTYWRTPGEAAAVLVELGLADE